MVWLQLLKPVSYKHSWTDVAEEGSGGLVAEVQQYRDVDMVTLTFYNVKETHHQYRGEDF